MLAARELVSAKEEDRTVHAVCHDSQSRVAGTLSLRQELPPEANASLGLADNHIELSEPEHRGKEQGIVSGALTELARPLKGFPDGRRRVPLRGHERRTNPKLER